MKKNSTDLVINSMDQDKVRHFVRPNPGSNHLPFMNNYISWQRKIVQKDERPKLCSKGSLDLSSFCIFCHFYGKSGATLWRFVHVNVISHVNINRFKMVEQRLCS